MKDKLTDKEIDNLWNEFVESKPANDHRENAQGLPVSTITDPRAIQFLTQGTRHVGGKDPKRFVYYLHNGEMFISHWLKPGEQ